MKRGFADMASEVNADKYDTCNKIELVKAVGLQVKELYKAECLAFE